VNLLSVMRIACPAVFVPLDLLALMLGGEFRLPGGFQFVENVSGIGSGPLHPY
jgi:hypothetical protein